MTENKRRIYLWGARNFRDLGGYSVADGRKIRWGVLYRSGDLHKLTKNDLRKLESLNLTRVFDFRAEHEAQSRPDQLPQGARSIRLPILDSTTKVWHEERDEMIKQMRTVNSADYLRLTNRELATQFTPQYRDFFRELLSADGEPLAFHCAAGKDRAGFAAASLLSLLGADWQIVVQDYLLTNRYLLDAHQWNLLFGSMVKGAKFTNVIRGFIKADAQYLSAAFDALNEKYGSFAGYVREGLQLSERDVNQLKETYLE
ncbi:MAG: tyrosine-protein phosphatase [Anaerolineales bacterium]|nr:tyrosine-protein phosphatase [Anaerolineales bacterium]